MLILFLSERRTSLLQFLLILLYNTDFILVCLCTNNAHLEIKISIDFSFWISDETPKRLVLQISETSLKLRLHVVQTFD